MTEKQFSNSYSKYFPLFYIQTLVLIILQIAELAIKSRNPLRQERGSTDEAGISMWATRLFGKRRQA